MSRVIVIAAALVLATCGGACTSDERHDRPEAWGDTSSSSRATILATTQAGELPPMAECPEGSRDVPPRPATIHHRRDPAPMAFDRASGQVVMLETRRAGDVVTWLFDSCERTWSRARPHVEPDLASPWRMHLVYDEDSDVTLAVSQAGSIWAYEATANRWTEAPRVPRGGLPVYDPVSGLVLIYDSVKLWAFDVETGHVVEVPQGRVTPPSVDVSELVAFDVAADRFVLYVTRPPATWLFDPREGTWARQETETPELNFIWGDLVSGGEIAYDAATEQVLILTDGVLVAHDSADGTWHRTGLNPGDRRVGRLSGFAHQLVYDPLDARILVHGGNSRTGRPAEPWVELHDMISLDPTSAQWHVLAQAR